MLVSTLASSLKVRGTACISRPLADIVFLTVNKYRCGYRTESSLAEQLHSTQQVVIRNK